MMKYFLPGCTTSANHPAAMKKLEKYFSKKGFAKGPCCKKDITVLQQGDVIITCCTNCDLIFAERTPYIRAIPLYEYVLNDEGFPWKDFSDRVLTIQDCWRMRNNRLIQDAVRECLKHMNITIMELPDNREKTEFCGVWLNNPVAPENLRYAPVTFGIIKDRYLRILTADEQKKLMLKRAEVYPTQEVAVYCNGCERGIKLGEKEPVHLVELLAAGL